MLKLIRAIINIIFPQKCLGCNAKNQTICKNCQNNILNARNNCQNLNSLHFKNLDNLIVAVDYKNKIIRKAIQLLKYNNIKNLAKPLSDLLYNFKYIYYPNKTNHIIIPIPLSPKRLKKRGYNQSELIANHLSNKLNIPLYNNILYKKNSVYSQVEIKNKKERLQNQKNLFEIRNEEQLRNATVFLIDDVITTGATINEAAYELRKNGAKKVIGLVVAKG